MAKRPDPSPKVVEQTLIELGQAPSMANAIISDYKLIVPIVLKTIGAEQIAAYMYDTQAEYNLASQKDWYEISSKAIVQWAEYVLREYKQQRLK